MELVNEILTVIGTISGSLFILLSILALKYYSDKCKRLSSEFDEYKKNNEKEKQ